MVLKKLGDILIPEFLEVVTFLVMERRMSVIVEPAVYQVRRWGGGVRCGTEGVSFEGPA